MRCPKCGNESSVIKNNHNKYNIKGRVIEFDSSRRFCTTCNNLLYDEELDQITSEMAINLYNKKFGISGEKILELRKKYGISADSFSKIIGCAKKTLLSYEHNESIPNDIYMAVVKCMLDDPDFIKAFLRINIDKFSTNEYDKIIKRIDSENLLDYEDDSNKNKMQRLTEYNGYTEKSIEKITNMIIFFSQNGVNKTKLLKEMFYSDFYYYKNNGCSITGLEYLKYDLGPVPKDYESILFNLLSKKIIKQNTSFYDNYEKHEIISLQSFDEKVFSNEELDLLKNIKNKFADFGSKKISDYSHKEIGYIKTDNNAMISYDYSFEMDL